MSQTENKPQLPPLSTPTLLRAQEGCMKDICQGDRIRPGGGWGREGGGVRYLVLQDSDISLKDQIGSFFRLG